MIVIKNTNFFINNLHFINVAFELSFKSDLEKVCKILFAY